MRNTKRRTRQSFTRTFIQGHIEHVVLALLLDEANHGYGLIDYIREQYHVYLGPSTIYPTLQWLAKRGLARFTWNLESGRPKKMYTITEKGRQTFRAEQREIRAILSKMVKPIC